MAYVRNPVVYVPDLTNGRPIVDGKVYLLTSGTVPPMHDSTIDPLDLLTVTYINEAGNTVEQPQPLYTSKGGCLYGNFPDAARQFMIAPQAYVFAAYNRIGELQYSAETSASDYVETDALAAVDSTVLVGGVEAGDLGGSIGSDRAVSIKQYVASVYDGTTDNTADILGWLSSLSPSYRGLVLLDSFVTCDLKQIVPVMPVGMMFIQQNARTGNNTGIFYEKSFGVVTKDAVDNDTITWTTSGHNSSRGFNNFRVSGTTSAALGRATDIWALGKIEGGQARNMGLYQWSKSQSGDWWAFSLRKEAPWVSVSNLSDMFEQWKTGKVITAGQYRKNSNMYVATTSGTTGASAPTHTSGMVSDGGVTWQYVSSGDATIFQIDEFGRIATNGGTSNAEWQNLTMSFDDPSASMNLYTRATGQSKQIVERNFPTNSSSVRTATPLIFHDGNDVTWSLRSSADSTNIIVVANDDVSFRKSTEFRSVTRKQSINTTANSATPSVRGINSLILSNTAATSITSLADGVQDQEVQLIATNGNTTLVHSSGFRLSGSANLVMTAFTVVTMRRISTAITTSWVEVSRSVK